MKQVPDSGDDHVAAFDQTIDHRWFIIGLFHRFARRGDAWQGTA